MRSLTKFQVKNDRRSALLRVSGNTRVSCHPEKERCTSTLSRQQAIWIRDGAMESGLTRRQRLTNRKWGSESEIAAPCDIEGENFDQWVVEEALEFNWNDLTENLKSAIKTRQDQGSSEHRRMQLTIEIAVRIGATSGCSGCAGWRSHTEACRVRSRRTLAGAKESESSRAVGAGIRLIEWSWSSNSQQRWCSRNHHHHQFPVLLRRCQNRQKTFRRITQCY